MLGFFNSRVGKIVQKWFKSTYFMFNGKTTFKVKHFKCQISRDFVNLRVTAFFLLRGKCVL